MGLEKKDFLTIRSYANKEFIIYWRELLKKITSEIKMILEKDDIDKIYDEDIERFVNKFLIQDILKDIPWMNENITSDGRKALDLNFFYDDLKKLKRGLSIGMTPSAGPVAIFSRCNHLVRENVNIADKVAKMISDEWE